MGSVHEPAAVWQRRADDSLDTELLDEDERAAHVDERVERAELVEVDVLRADAVDATLDLGEPLECLERASAGALGKVGRRDELADLAVVAMGVVVGGVDAQVQCADPLALDTLDVDLHALDAECGRDAAKRVELGACVQQRRDEHVACETADTVQVEDAAQSRPRAMRAAIVPAPSPSSMPTTARPAAHDASIAFSAVVPPCAEP